MVVEASDDMRAVEAVAKHRPEVVILDVNLPDLNGVDVCRQIKSQMLL